MLSSVDLTLINDAFHLVAKAEHITAATGVTVSVVPSARDLCIYHNDGTFTAASMAEAHAFLSGILSAVAAAEATKPVKEAKEAPPSAEEPTVACHELLINDEVGEALQGLLQALSDPKAARSDVFAALAILTGAILGQ